MASAQPNATLKMIAQGIQLREGKRGSSIRFFVMVSGQRFTRTCTMPIDFAISRGKPTRELNAEYGKFVEECAGRSTHAKGKVLRTPTIDELIRAYEKIAWARNANKNYGKPSVRTIETAVKNYHYCVEASGLRGNRPYTELTDTDTVRKIFKFFCERKTANGRELRGVTAWSYCASLQSVTAKWCIVEYRDMGFKVEQPVMPDFGKAKQPPQYRELPKDMIRKIWDWYLTLENNAGKDCVFYATCMLELLIRPNDIGRLTAENFPLDPNGHHRLAYTPAKTSESSNRRVDIEIPDALYEKLHGLVADRWDAGELLLPNWIYVERQMNFSMRVATGMRVEDYPKATYELRKLGTHIILNTPVEQGGGIEQAVRLTGDRRDTMEKYYCDPYKSHTALPHRPIEQFVKRMGGGI